MIRDPHSAIRTPHFATRASQPAIRALRFTVPWLWRGDRSDSQIASGGVRTADRGVRIADRGVRIAVLTAVCLFALAFVYRFNTLGDTLGGFENDEFLVVSRAAQILHGEWPSRDFVDSGLALTYVLSAFALRLFDGALVGHALLTVGALSLGVALVFWLSWHLTRSYPAALTAAVLALIAAPRCYNYPKIALYAIWLLLAWRHVERPSWGRLAALGPVIAASFLIRHDHGVYLAIMSAVAAACTAPNPRVWVRQVSALAAFVVLCLVPWAIYIQYHVGLPQYVQSVAAWARRDAERTELRPPPFTFDVRRKLFEISELEPLPLPHINVRYREPLPSEADRSAFQSRYGLEPREQYRDDAWTYAVRDASPATLAAIAHDPLVLDTHGIDRGRFALTEPPPAPRGWERLRREWPALRLRMAPGLLHGGNGLPFLYYGSLALVLLAVGTLIWGRARITGLKAPAATAKLTVLVCLAALLHYFFLRGSLEARIADVSVPVAVLGAALGAIYWRGRVVAPLVIVVLIAFSVRSLDAVADVRTELRRAGFTSGPDATWARSRFVWRRLAAAPPLPAVATPGEPDILRVARYLRDCTAPSDRVLLMAYTPEVFYYADRRFAGGLLFAQPGFFTSEADQRLAIGRLREQSVPLVITPDEQEYEQVYRETFPVLTRYVDVRYREAGRLPVYGGHMRVLAERNRRTSSVHPGTGLPCFVGAAAE